MKDGVPAYITRAEFKSIMEVFSDVELVPMFGTLLGLHRDGDIIDDDDDIDFGVDISKFSIVKNRLIENDYIVDDGSYPNTTDYFIQAYRIIDGYKILFDFYFWEVDSDLEKIIVKWTVSADQSRDDDLHIPYKYVYPVFKKPYRGIEILYPADPKSCCLFFYGKKWRTPLQKGLDYFYKMENHSPIIEYYDKKLMIEKRNTMIEELKINLRGERLRREYVEKLLLIEPSDYEQAFTDSSSPDIRNEPVEPSSHGMANESAEARVPVALSPQKRLVEMTDLLIKALATARIFSPQGPLGALLTEEMVMTLIRSALDKEWYLKSNPDVAAAGVDPFLHFLNYGLKEGRSPHPFWKH